MAPHSNPLAWKIPWTEEPGRLQSMGLRRIRQDWVTSLSLFTFMHWRRQWQPTPFLPGESQGWGSLVGCRLWGLAESDTTEATQQQQQHQYKVMECWLKDTTFSPDWNMPLGKFYLLAFIFFLAFHQVRVFLCFLPFLLQLKSFKWLLKSPNALCIPEGFKYSILSFKKPLCLLGER